MAEPSPGTSGLLTFPVFRALWIATIISKIGTWMHDVGAAWMMTSLSPSPLLVALVQAATTLPMFLLARPAGAMADIVGRRRLLLAVQLLGLAAAAALSVLTLLDLTGPGFCWRRSARRCSRPPSRNWWTSRPSPTPWR